MDLTPGQTYAGKYRIVRVIGGGAMGAVYEAENVLISRRVAIKVLHANVAQRADALRRFEREAQAAGRIGSSHIVEVLDVGELPSGDRFMVMEFLEGVTLQQRIRLRGRLTPEEATPIVSQILEGLGAAHQAEIIHRDLKPANVFLTTARGGREGGAGFYGSGSSEFVKILDFGVSKFNVLNDEMSMTSTGAVLGTPFYMSPEQAKGSRTIDWRSDLYAVGVILYECITGQVPFSAETFNELIFRIVLESPLPVESFVPVLDPEFAAIIHKAMARQPEDRYQSAADFQAALAEWAANAAAGLAPVVPLPALSPSARQSTGSWPASGRPALAAGGTVMMGEAPGARATWPAHGGTISMDPARADPVAPQGMLEPWMQQPPPVAPPLPDFSTLSGAMSPERGSSTSHGTYVVPKQGGGIVALLLGLVGVLTFAVVGLMVIKWNARRDLIMAATSAPAPANSSAEKLANNPPAPVFSAAPAKEEPSAPLPPASAPAESAAASGIAAPPREPDTSRRAVPTRATPPGWRVTIPRLPARSASPATPSTNTAPGRRTISTDL